MTIIVYRDGVMASDSLIQDSGVRVGAQKKVFKSKDGTVIAAASGRIECIERFGKWLENTDWSENHIINESVFDTKSNDGEFVALISTSGYGQYSVNTNLYRMGANGILARIDAPFYTDGSGANIALGALAMGASAVRAVEIAIGFCVTCGGNVQKAELKPKPLGPESSSKGNIMKSLDEQK